MHTQTRIDTLAYMYRFVKLIWYTKLHDSKGLYYVEAD